MKKRLLKIAYAILDSCFAWFTPSWRRKGCAALSDLTRYLNYFGHKMSGEKRASLEEKQSKLRDSLLAWDKEGTVQATGQLENVSESIPAYKRNPLAEIVESFFVIMVVFMGIRTYYAQPFRIPTGSMQPTLNGIIIHPIDEVPGLPARVWDGITLGSSYVDITANNTKAIAGFRQRTKYFFFTETLVQFDDGSSECIPCAEGATREYFQKLGKYDPITKESTPFEPGEVIMRARIDAGDMVFVNRMAYHFRKPERGETFVFDTRGIKTRGDNPLLADQNDGTHYIKRLCGLPGDKLQIQDSKLIVNGEVAQEPTIRRVMAGQPPYNPQGYVLISAQYNGSTFLSEMHPERTLKNPKDTPNLREYAALGDNTVNSLDSRYWGPVHQFNVLGPASFTLWPFTSHWGKID